MVRLSCNINRRGRVLRLLFGLVAVIPVTNYLLGSFNITLAQTITLGLGIFAIFESIKGWCVVVELLERLRRGVTRNKLASLLLGSLAD